MVWTQAAETLAVRQISASDERNTAGVELTGTSHATRTGLLDVSELLRQKAMRAASNKAKRSEKRKALEGSSKERGLKLSTQEKKV
jgi:hypothetical protein